MKKIIILLAVILFTTNLALASSPKPDYAVRLAISKYKAKNYTGCLQDLEKYTEKKQTGLALYYLAMSYTQAGRMEDALERYNQAIELAEKEKNNFLKSYAMIGKKKIENPELFPGADDYDEISATIKRKTTIPPSVKNDLKSKHLEYLRNQINAGVEPNF